MGTHPIFESDFDCLTEFRTIKMYLSRVIRSKPKTGILMMNMGGPSTIPEVKPFLTNLFNDRDLLKLPFNQAKMADFIVWRRYQKIERYFGNWWRITYWYVDKDTRRRNGPSVGRFESGN